MTDPDGYYSNLNRQRAKLAYARSLLPHLQRCVQDVGPNPSYSVIARWLEEQGVKPSAGAKEGAKWNAQVITDYLLMDGLEPTTENIETYIQERDRANKLGQRKVARKFGFRITISARWRENEWKILSSKGEERRHYDEQQLAKHIDEVVKVASALRAALLIR